MQQDSSCTTKNYLVQNVNDTKTEKHYPEVRPTINTVCPQKRSFHVDFQYLMVRCIQIDTYTLRCTGQ
jgi:hypothetical protein